MAVKTLRTSTEQSAPLSLAVNALWRILLSHRQPWNIVPAYDQDLKQYTLLNEHLSSKVGEYDRDAVFGKKSFDQSQKQVRRKSTAIFIARVIFWASICASLVLLVYTHLTASPLLTTLTVLCTIIWVGAASVLTQMLSGNADLSAKQLIAQSSHPKHAEMVVHELERNIFGKYGFYFVDQNGVIQQLPRNIHRVENALVFFLGPPKHRQIVPYSGAAPQQELYISKSQPTNNARLPSAIREFLTTKECVVEMILLVDRHLPYDPAKPRRKLTRDRERWTNTLRIIRDNWNEWVNLESGGHNSIEIENKLLRSLMIRNKSKEQMDDLLNNFITGDNRNFGNWLVQLDFIDPKTRKLAIKKPN